MNQQANKNYNNNDTRCGLLMTVRVNCNYIMSLYSDWDCKGGELTYLGEDKYEEKTLEVFWEEYNKKATYCIEKNGNNEEELMYLFEEHIEDWKDKFEWKLEEEEEEEEEEEREDCEECGDIGIECIWSKKQGCMVCEECLEEVSEDEE